MLQYVLILIWEIVKANIVVLKLVITDRYVLEPALVHVTPELQSETARVVLANSITLTPGTYTVGITEHELRVHCLDKDLSVGMEQSIFVRQLKKIETVIYQSKKDQEAAQ